MREGKGNDLLPCPRSQGRVAGSGSCEHSPACHGEARTYPGATGMAADRRFAGPHSFEPHRCREVKSSIQVRDKKGNTMNRTKLRHRPATGFFGLAAAVLLMATASLAQAQNALYWNQTGSAAWSTSSQLDFHHLAGNGITKAAASSTMAERQPSPPETASRTTPTAPVMRPSLSAAAAPVSAAAAGMDMSP